MKKIFQLLIFCCLTTLAWGTTGYEINNNNCPPVDSSCTVYLSMDSTNTGDIIIIANAIGDAPFAYQWSTGETTQSIILTQWGINYCVTITSASGCTATGCIFNNSCYVDIDADPSVGLVTSVSGVLPMSFLWNNGQTTQNILPNAPGTYCVTMTDAAGCVTSACEWWGILPDSCGVYINYDSSGLIAIANGNAPFSYLWNLGQTTQSIQLNPTYFGDYCVTITDAEGCVSAGCIWSNNPCSVWIIQEDNISHQHRLILCNSDRGRLRSFVLLLFSNYR
jgi:hypothetical protein